MRNQSIISNNKLTSGLEIFLAVGNMGDTIMYLLPSNEALVYSPAKNSPTYKKSLLTKCEEGFFICSTTKRLGEEPIFSEAFGPYVQPGCQEPVP